MPPPIIAPSLSSNLVCIHCDSNSLGNSHQCGQKNEVFSADRGNDSSVSNKLNADSGSSGTYIAVCDTEKLTEVKPCTPASRIGVMVANGQTIFSTHTGSLALPSGHSLRAYIFSNLKTSLLSISDLADIGYRITYSKLIVEFVLSGKTIFEGQRDRRTGLWMVDFSVLKSKSNSVSSPSNKYPSGPTTKFAQPAVEVNNQREFVAYWHAAFGYPSKTTFVSNILNGNIVIDGLSVTTVRRNFSPSVFTAMGHLDATRSNIKSTKLPFTSEIEHPHKIPLVWIGIHESTGRMHSDQTGALPILGKHKEKYLVIFFDEKSNFIHCEPTLDLSGKQLSSATERGLSFFKARGSTTTAWRLDNQISSNVRKVLAKENITIDLTPVGQHRRNKAERAIRTFKNHFIATLAGVSPECPLELWTDFIEQIEFTLNLMRTSPSGPSAWSALHGPADLNKSPIAPLGIKVVAHIPVKDRASWDSHGDVGFYVGRAIDHYRCYRVWIPKTKDYRISDCLAWFPATIQVNSPANVNPVYPLVPPGFAPLPAVIAPSLVPPPTGGK